LFADPKPLQAPFKLTPGMVEAMSMAEGRGYERFKSHCLEAFTILRKSSSLIINLFSLMVDSGIRQIKESSIKTVRGFFFFLFANLFLHM
jgi:phosphatidylinositol 3-kinase